MYRLRYFGTYLHLISKQNSLNRNELHPNYTNLITLLKLITEKIHNSYPLYQGKNPS